MIRVYPCTEFTVTAAAAAAAAVDPGAKVVVAPSHGPGRRIEKFRWQPGHLFAGKTYTAVALRPYSPGRV